MNKRKKLGFTLLAVLLLATTAFLYFRATDQPIRVTGSLSKEDVAAIKSIVHRQIWRSTFPDFSFQTFRHLPAAIKNSLNLRLDSIDTLADDDWLHSKTASANVLSGKSARGDGYTYVCAKTSNQWIFVVRVGPQRDIDLDPVRKLPP